MRFHNGHSRIDTFKAGVHDFYESVADKTADSRKQIKSWASDATELIKAHPYVAVGVAFGLGYVVIKIARR